VRNSTVVYVVSVCMGYLIASYCVVTARLPSRCEKSYMQRSIGINEGYS
jgi:hypothetical protein